MRATLVSVFALTLVAGAGTTALRSADAGGPVQNPLGIEGTYKLVLRELPDGTREEDDLVGTGLRYDLAGPSGSSPVTRTDGAIEFQLPLFGEPKVAFRDGGMTASREGEFVDHWEKVE